MDKPIARMLLDLIEKNKKLNQPKPLKARKGSYRARGGDFTTNPGGASSGGVGGAGSIGGGAGGM